MTSTLLIVQFALAINTNNSNLTSKSSSIGLGATGSNDSFVWC